MAQDATPSLMLIDDTPAQRRVVSAIAARTGWRTLFVDDGETAIATLGTPEGMRLNAIVIEQRKHPEELLPLIGALRERRPKLPLIVLTGDNDVAAAVEAMRAGAADYLTKPIAPERLIAALNAASREKDAGELRPLAEKISAPLAIDEIVGSAPRFRAALAIAAKAARSRVPVLIEGECGVGKETVARAIHAASPRARNRLVAVNCSAIPANLMESELFGHERGAFTGAFERQIGRFIEADAGTLFLDEVSELPMDAQVKLLRVLQDGEIRPLGARMPSHVDVRIIAATNKKLADEIEAGRFREDLYYRLNVVQLTIPPLRERTTDIPALARHLLARMARQPGMQSLGITAEALDLLMRYDWPGNVRQLQSALFRAAVRCESSALTPQDFPRIASLITTRRDILPASSASGRLEGAGVTLYESDGHVRPLADIEADIIRLAIGHYRGRMTEVARRLGIGRSTLYRKLAELGIDLAA